MKDTIFEHSSRNITIANRMYIIIVIVYGLSKTGLTLLHGTSGEWLSVMFFSTLSLAGVIFINFFIKSPRLLAFFMPSVIMLCALCYSLFVTGTPLVFLIFICVGSISGLYYHNIGSLVFWAAANILSVILLFLFKYPIFGVNIGQSDIYMLYLVSNITIFCITFRYYSAFLQGDKDTSMEENEASSNTSNKTRASLNNITKIDGRQTNYSRNSENMNAFRTTAVSSENVQFLKTKNVLALLVDDNYINLLVSYEILKKYGVEADQCKTGASAIKKVQEKTYDLIFMDHMMPEMDGIEATQAIRALGGYCLEVPIIALSANTAEGILSTFKKAGMNDFLSKPISVKSLNRILLSYLPKYKIISDNTENVTEAHGNNGLEYLFNHIKEIDPVSALQNIGGSKTSYINVLKNFYLSYDKKLPLMINLYENGSLNSLKIEIHGIKGVLAQIGAYSLSVEARKIENAISEKDFHYVSENLDAFFEKIKKFLPLLKQVLFEEQETKQEKPTGDLCYLTEQMAIIKDYIDILDQNSAIESLEKLQHLTFGSETDKKIAVLANALEMFNYSKAAELCSNILTN